MNLHEFLCVRCHKEFRFQPLDPLSAIHCPGCGSVHLQVSALESDPMAEEEIFDETWCACDDRDDSGADVRALARKPTIH